MAFDLMVEISFRKFTEQQLHETKFVQSKMISNLVKYKDAIPYVLCKTRSNPRKSHKTHIKVVRQEKAKVVNLI